MTLEAEFARIMSEVRRPADKPYFLNVVYNGLSIYESAAHLSCAGAPEGYVFWQLERKFSRAVVRYLWVGPGREA